MIKRPQSYTVMVILEAKSGKELALKRALASVIAPSLSESTCLEYRLHEDLSNPARFFIRELGKQVGSSETVPETLYHGAGSAA